MSSPAPNPKLTDAFAKVGLICGRFRDMDPGQTVAAVATSDGHTTHLTYGHLRELLTAAYQAGDQLQRISSWHSLEAGEGGLVGKYCVECGHLWPCDSRRMADGTHEDLAAEFSEPDKAQTHE